MEECVKACLDCAESCRHMVEHNEVCEDMS
jgi:hypothetical protein